MSRLKTHEEGHLIERIGWLRAAVLGANDGIVSTASLIVGVAAAASGKAEVITAGMAGLVAGAMSMAAGEYVSVSSQSDTERSDIARERAELATFPDAELAELAGIYQSRGLTRQLALEVATALTTHDALKAHLRDELGISSRSTAKPVQAAITSALTFAGGAAMPLAVVFLVPLADLPASVATATLFFLAILGWLGATLGGAASVRPIVRVMFWVFWQWLRLMQLANCLGLLSREILEGNRIMSHLTRVTLRLARNPDAGFPEGADDRGYVLVAPLDKDRMLDADLWRANRHHCTVTRFSPIDEERADGVLTHRGSHWRFAYDEDNEGPDETGWKLAAHRFEPGAYVTITSGDGDALVYRVTEAIEV